MADYYYLPKEEELIPQGELMAERMPYTDEAMSWSEISDYQRGWLDAYLAENEAVEVFANPGDFYSPETNTVISQYALSADDIDDIESEGILIRVPQLSTE